MTDERPGIEERLAQAAEVGSWAEVHMRGAIANHLPASQLEETELAYGDHPDQRIRLVWPLERVRERSVVFIHGGSWQGGDPDSYGFVGRFLAREGFPTALIGYRHVPEFVFPTQIDDVFAAIQAARTYLLEHDLPAEELALSGHSAGAHLAALALLDRERAERSGLAGRFDRALLFSGPLDFDYLCADDPCVLIEALMDGPPPWDEADPVKQLCDPLDASMLLVHGTEDLMVDVGTSASFVRAANELRDGIAELIVVDGAHHMDVLDAFLGGREGLAERIVGFLGE